MSTHLSVVVLCAALLAARAQAVIPLSINNVDNESAVSIDSGWATPTPSTRAAAEFGAELSQVWTDVHAHSSGGVVSRVLLTATETLVAAQYLVATHELGHANRVRAAGGDFRFEDGSTSYWRYLGHHRVTGTAATYWDLPTDISRRAMYSVVTGGLNTTATVSGRLAEVSPAWASGASLGAWIYYFSPPSPELDDMRQLSALWKADGLAITPRDMRMHEVAGYILGRLPLQFASRIAASAGFDFGVDPAWLPLISTHYSERGISQRVRWSFRDGSILAWDVAVEAIVRGRFTADAEVGWRWRPTANIEIGQSVLIGRHGAGVSAAVSRRVGALRFVFGATVHNPRTLAGMRDGASVSHNTTEIYAQIHFAQ